LRDKAESQNRGGEQEQSVRFKYTFVHNAIIFDKKTLSITCVFYFSALQLKYHKEVFMMKKNFAAAAFGAAVLLLFACNNAPKKTPQYSLGSTPANIYAAYASELKARTAYLASAKAAENEGYIFIARFFHAIAQAEYFHSESFQKLLESLDISVKDASAIPFLSKTTRENLLYGINTEQDEAVALYKVFSATAKQEGNQSVAALLDRTLGSEISHGEALVELLEALDKNDFSQLEDIYICANCGKVEFNKRPARCSNCGELGRFFLAY
jgi:rubrerythrin